MKLMRFQYQQQYYEGIAAYDRVVVVRSIDDQPLHYCGLSFALDEISILSVKGGDQLELKSVGMAALSGGLERQSHPLSASCSKEPAYG